MAMFGDKTIFAVEIEECGKEDIFFFCFWCHEKQIGDFSMPVYIKYCINFIGEFLLYNKNRHLKESCDIHKERLFYELYDGMMAPDEKIQIKTYKLLSEMPFGEKRVIFHLDEIGQDSFRDKLSILLINEEEKKRQRLIWRDLKDVVLHEEFLPLNYVDDVFSELLIYFDE